MNTIISFMNNNYHQVSKVECIDNQVHIYYGKSVKTFDYHDKLKAMQMFEFVKYQFRHLPIDWNV